MERPQKRPRLGLAPHDESDDDDELNYEPEEISQRRDPGARLARSRATAAFGLKSAFESIFERYERDFEGVADEIDLRTADIVVDNRHLEGMRNERDMGNMAKETEEEEIPVHDGGAAGGDGAGAGARDASADDEDEDQILQWKSSAMVRKAPGTLVPRTSHSLGQRPGISSQLRGPPQLPPLGTSPLFFGSWGPPGAMDPAWQAPQLQVPQFKSSFAADLFTGRYQLPAREASKSIWAPGSHSDDDEDGPPEKPMMRLAPPTRRIPARPKAMKLIRAPPTNADDSGDEDFILMGVNASQVPNGGPRPLPDEQGSGVIENEADLLLDRLERELDDGNETEYRDGTLSSASTQPVTHPEGPSAVANSERRTDRRSDLPVINHWPSAKGNRGSPLNKKKGRQLPSSRKALLGDEPSASVVVTSASSAIPANHNVQKAVTNQRESVVIELPSSCLLDDGSYLDFSGKVDLLTDDSHSPPIPDDHPSPYLTDQRDRIVEDVEDSQIPSSDRTIPDSRDPPVPLPASSASNAPTKQILGRPRQDKEKQKGSSLYDLSDDEMGFLARPPRKRKRILDFTRSNAIGERTPAGTIADTDAEALTSPNRCVEHGVPTSSKPVTAQTSSEGLFSPARTRSAKVKANPAGASLPEYSLVGEAADSTRRPPGKRRLTPTSLNSADDTEGETVPTQGQVNPPLPVALVSPPPEIETEGMAAAAEERSNVQAESLEPVADVALIDDDRSRVTKPARTRTTRDRPADATDDTAPSPKLTGLSHDRLVPNAVSSHGESQNTVNVTPRGKRHAKSAAASPSSLQFKPATPSKLRLSLPNTPTSVPSTGHRSLTSLVPEESPDNESEDELTSSSLFSLFQKPTPAPPSSRKSARRRGAPEGTPTKPRRRVSAMRLSAAFRAERPSAPEESVMRTPGGTIRKCGERGLKCGKDFCFTCC